MDFKHSSSGNIEEDEFFIRSPEGIDSFNREDLFGTFLPDLAAILDENRRVVFVNNCLLELLNADGDQSFIGLRPGDLFGCIHALETVGGCGTTAACKYCGAFDVIKLCQETGSAQESECRIMREPGDLHPALDLWVKASPLLKTRNYILLSILDISDRKRRALFEDMFLQQSLVCAKILANRLKHSESRGLEEDTLNELMSSALELKDSLQTFSTLTLAERGELQVNPQRFSSLALITEIAAQCSHSLIAEGKRIFIHPFSHAVWMQADSSILNVVLKNLIKNALESVNPDDVIQMGTQLVDKYVRFWVNNAGQMTAEIKHQIFQRSFSTRDGNRGIGTYLIKLLTTKYLKGKTGFETNEESGITFWIEIPLTPDIIADNLVN